MNMCELSLDETGLSSKKGAEILENEFEQEWLKNGGRKYLKSNIAQISSKYVVQLFQTYR
jgi:myosin-6